MVYSKSIHIKQISNKYYKNEDSTNLIFFLRERKDNYKIWIIEIKKY